MRQNTFVVGSPPRTPLGELTALPQTLLAGLGEGNGQGAIETTRDGKGTEGEEKRGRRGKEKGIGIWGRFRGG